MPNARRSKRRTVLEETPPRELGSRQPEAIETPSRRARAIAGAVVMIAAVVRVAGLGKDLWLDEVWSVRAASELASPWNAFTMHHEINHHLNTLWLHFLGPNASAAMYHLPSYLFGIAAVGIAGAIGFRRGSAAGIATTGAFALSYEMVLYSSEARGYSTLVFSVLLAFYALESAIDDGSMRWSVVYWIACLIGILSHPIFAGFLGAAVVWTVWRSRQSKETAATMVRSIIRTQAVPVLALGLLWTIDLRLVAAGGGTPADSFIGVYGSALAWAVAAGRPQGVELVSCVLVVAMIASAIGGVYKADAGRAVFFVSAIVVFPIALVLIRGSDLVYTRHFLIAGVFTLLLFGLTLGRWWAEGRKRVVALAGAAFVFVNAINIVTLARDGRGRYQEAIEYMAATTTGDTVTIAGDHDFRIGTEMSYYIPRATTTKRVQYLEEGHWPANGPEWLVAHRESWVTQAPEAQFELAPGLRYSLAKVLPTAPLSGLNWYLYHRVAEH